MNAYDFVPAAFALLALVYFVSWLELGRKGELEYRRQALGLAVANIFVAAGILMWIHG